ncbi:Mzm1p NDAI_0A07150 [Naumovozyma dairenensis CBS 421]|uniref:Mitochondrial zinc maintenance protein 1, mitochondrial n=1 Tax=Naumovozyma dairenensis (strain ATCC 10597 / BCRC 20456 / CBS 421 / NBRC 0211 / NRRL Y-12639) TaxID=1071378 RepID=G0W4Y1_NAUDC|nr:hypothetical protein NDAI_0A07150 [Naumovozyma dairenensis CBS 421]CCD22869.1 hypothetical protein NDAI_0A07150 [Naumovozyma dairenensis CBS 421]
MILNAPLKTRALRAYRHGLRATKIAFNNDTRMLVASRVQMREAMRNSSTKNSNETEIQHEIKHLEEVAILLKRNVVQGVKETTVADSKYHLNIHKDIELGDNDTLKKASKRNSLTSGVVEGGCCGGL